MKTRIILNRGTAAENDLFTGFPGEIVYDTTNQTIRIHDGVSVGGVKLVKVSANNTLTATVLNSNTINSNTVNSNIVNSNSIAANTAQFFSAVVVNEPTSNTQLANKSYVDRKIRLAIALSGI